MSATAKVIDALGLPACARVQQRVPKKALLEQGMPTAADRRAVQSGVDSIMWIAALKPTNIGVPVYRDAEREYLEIAVLALTLRGKTKPTRLAELIHRVIPYPVALVAGGDDGCSFSVAHKRWSQVEAGKVVIEDVYATGIFHPDESTEPQSAFLDSVALDALPRADLRALYEGWADRIRALAAADITGAFNAPAAASRGDAFSADIETHKAIDRELVSLRSQARKERQMNKRVTLNLDIKQREANMAAIAERLGGSDA